MSGGAHPKALGRVDDIPYLARQQRLIFARCGVTDPLSLEDYRRHGGLRGLERALTLGPKATVEEVLASGLRGRGGAGFPTGIKWRTTAGIDADQKYVVCNADEGDSGTFADRMLMEGDPFLLIEGMAIAGVSVGATKGYVYIRSEYPHAFATFQRAIERARAGGLLGPSVLGSAHAFDLEARLGAGAYICGEETSLLESLEGKRGQIRAKPPLPAIKGLFGKPTVINNVLSFASTPWILEHGAKAYAAYGVGRSLGSQPFQLAGNIRYGGLVELAFGATLRELVEGFGGGTRTGRPIRAVQVGGPLGAYLPESLLDTPLDYESMAAVGGMLGHGGIVVFDDSVDMARQARFAMEFCAKESCGKCTPCRIGSTRGVETVDKIIAGRDRQKNVATVARSLRGDDGRLALRSRRTCPHARPQRAQSFQRGFRQDAGARRGGIGDEPMALLQELDTGTPIRTGEATVTLTIDGRKVSVPPGTSVMAAAALIDNPIPKLCATDSLEAFGSCRLCLVEIEGRRGTPASCTTPAEEGMVVHTRTSRLQRLRRGVMELYASDYPLDTLTSSANGDSEFQTQAAIVGLREVRYGRDGANHLNAPVDASNPYFTFDPAACIVCSRCVRACEEVQGTFALTILGRGFESKVGTGGVDFLSSECVSCGACVQACPTSALNEKSVIEMGAPERTVVTTCAYCGVGCAFKAELKGDEVVAHDSLQGRQGQRGPLLRQGPVRLRLRHA